MTEESNGFGYPYEQLLAQTFPGLHRKQNEWLSSIDSLEAPDRKTHELIRLACVTILRNEPGIEHHARVAAEVGASWPEVMGAVLLTQPAFGVQPAVHALPIARRGFERATSPEVD